MLQPFLDRYMLIGVVCACLWSFILPVIPLRIELVRIGVVEIQADRVLSQEEKLGILSFGACALVLLLVPLGIGWFVAQKSTRVRTGAKRRIAARDSALRGALSVSLGMLPLTTLIVFWNLARSMLAGNISEILAWGVVFFVVASLGALGGVLWFWIRSDKTAGSHNTAENANEDVNAPP